MPSIPKAMRCSKQQCKGLPGSPSVFASAVCAFASAVCLCALLLASPAVSEGDSEENGPALEKTGGNETGNRTADLALTAILKQPCFVNMTGSNLFRIENKDHRVGVQDEIFVRVNFTVAEAGIRNLQGYE